MKFIGRAKLPGAAARCLNVQCKFSQRPALARVEAHCAVAGCDARGCSGLARPPVIWVTPSAATVAWLQHAQQEIVLNRIALWLSGLAIGASIACFAGRSLDVAEVRRYKEACENREAEKRVAAEVPPDNLARRLMRKNSTVAVEKAYTFVDVPPLGEGAFGVVHRAIHNTSGIERAVKCIDKSAVLDDGQLLREVEAMRLMDHPHVCRFVEYFETGRHLWIVTELCRGEELCDRVLGLPAGLPEADIASWMRQMLRATLHCHRRAVVHRDLKPENFLFQHDARSPSAPPDTLKLIDFGFAVPAANDSPAAGMAAPSSAHFPAAGTLLYMSPQVLRGEAASVNDDMWSLGVIFHILLTGKFPFSTNEDSRFEELLHNGALERDVQQHLATLSGSAEAVDLARRLLTADPNQRITAEGALRHPFFAGKEAQQPEKFDAQEVCERSARFWQSCRLRRIVIAILAQLMDDSRGEKERAKATFVSLDKAGDGRISMRDLEEFVRQASCPSWWPSSWLGSSARLGCWPPSAEAHGIGYTAFVAATLDEAALGDGRLLQAAFELLDADGDGTVSAQDLQRRLGLPLAEGERALAEALQDPAGLGAPGFGTSGGEISGNRLDSKDFVQLMQGTKQGTDGEWRSGFSNLAAQS